MNPNWLLYNYLSEITPFPEAWDVTSASAQRGSGGCGAGAYGASATATACKAVEKYLDGLSTNTSTYTAAPWNVVDGPWKLAAFDTLGNATFVPEPDVLRPPEGTRGQGHREGVHLVHRGGERPLRRTSWTSATSTRPSSQPRAGARQVGGQIAALKGTYNLVTGSPWSFNYAPFNFAKARPEGSPC